MPCDFLLLAGSANTELAHRISEELAQPLAPCSVEHFPDGEVSVELGAAVRRSEVFIIQPTSPPVNERVMELALLADACRRSGAARITGLIPYFGYARGDKRQARRVPVNARLVADLLQRRDCREPRCGECDCFAGRRRCATRAREFARCFGLSMALCLKQRTSGVAVAISGVVGDVRNRPCVIVDDMITSGGTVVESARALHAAGARDVSAVVATHGVLAPGAADRIAQEAIRRVVITDTVARDANLLSLTSQYQVISVAPVLAAVVPRLVAGESLRDVG